MRLKSPRYCLPRTTGGNGPATNSLLRKLNPDHIVPERLYLETRRASLVPGAAAAELLADVLPINCRTNAATVRQHGLRPAGRIERELTEDKSILLRRIHACATDHRIEMSFGRRVDVPAKVGVVSSHQATNFMISAQAATTKILRTVSSVLHTPVKPGFITKLSPGP